LSSRIVRRDAWRTFGTVLLVAGCRDLGQPTGPVDADVPDASSSADAADPASHRELTLVASKKLGKVVSDPDIDHYEASGVTAVGGKLYVVSDNVTKLAIIDASLTSGVLGPGDASESQYEAITSTDDGRLFVMKESADDADTRGQIVELDSTTAVTGTAYADTVFPHTNKGFEGLAWVRAGDEDYLLALCENNRCQDDDSDPGEGRVHVLSLSGGIWTTQLTMKLPESAAFLDYSDLALLPLGADRYSVAVVSHKSSELWLGTLDAASWAFLDEGVIYDFPLNDDGELQYCSLEGVTFLGPTIFGMVSDKSEDDACKEQAESVHVFQAAE